jgi:hypothetical protein
MPARKSARPKSRKRLIVRILEPATRRRTARAGAPAEPEIPEVVIQRKGGPVSIAIAFGHAQHGTYTIQLFDPDLTTELARETGSSTDHEPDRFDLKLTPAQLDRHCLQWTGAVDAFSNAPGQRYSVIFDVIQGGNVVKCGDPCEKTGPLDSSQTFLGVIRLVTS